MMLSGPPKPHQSSLASEDGWHLVSPSGSERSAASSTRSSLDVALNSPSDRNSISSEAARENEALADSVLGQPALVAELLQEVAAEAVAACPAATLSTLDPESVEAARSISGLSGEGSLGGLSDDEDAHAALTPGGGNGAAGAEAAALPPPAAGLAARRRRLAKAAQGVLAQVAAAQAGAGAALARELAVLRSWMVESFDLLLRSARSGGDGLRAALAASLGRLAALLPARLDSSGKASAGDVEWRVVGLAAGCVVAAAAAVFAFYKNFKLAHDLRARDRELAKLVMRVVSLQELMAQQRHHLPIARYTSYSSSSYAHTCP